MKKFTIKTLGCKVNQYDSLTLKRGLEKLGFVYTQEDGEENELVIVNSCAVTKTSIKKGKRMLSLARRDNPNAKVVLLGCWVKTYPEQMEEIGADLVWEVGKLNELVLGIGELFAKCDICGKDILKDLKIDPPKQGEKARYFLKIQDGCEQFCSYCIIPFSRGKLYSRSEEEVLTELKNVIAAGYEEIVLCGIHLGLYGKEKDSKTCNLNELINKMIQVPGLGRIRLSSIEVNDVDDGLLKLMAKSDKICKHLHFPLQAGSDKILDLMNRPYTKKYFLQRVESARKLMPKIALTTDVIVGFPGETDADFRESFELCREVKFSKIHVFPFSAHEKTPAYSMKNQVNKEDKIARAKKLRALSVELENEYKKSFGGETLELLIESVEGDEFIGKSQFYFNVKQKKTSLKKESFVIGKLVDVKVVF